MVGRGCENQITSNNAAWVVFDDFIVESSKRLSIDSVMGLSPHQFQ